MMALTRFTLRQLEAFATVAETLSFTDAGDRLGLTPSAVSQLVLELEAVVGLRLFDRSTRKVEISATGRELLNSAEAVLRYARLTETAAEDLRDYTAGIVRIGAPQVIAGFILPEIIASFSQQHPRVKTLIRDTAVERLVDVVSVGEVDLSIGPDRPYGANVTRQPLFESPWVLWCSPSHALAGKSEVRWEDLRGIPIVAAGRDHERSVQRMRASLPDEERITPSQVVDQISTALGIAAAGQAVTLSPAYVGILAKRFGLKMRRVREPESIRQVCLYSPSHRTLSPAAAGFAELLPSQIQEMLRDGAIE